MRALLAGCVLVDGCATAPQVGGEVRSGNLPVPGASIYFEEAGQGDAVVLIHGGFGDRRMWDAQFATLSREYRVVRYDHRGFGRSRVLVDSAYSPPADLVRLLDHLGIDKAHVIGNSVGGSVALDFALLHPDRVGKVVVVASGASGAKYSAEDVASIVAVFKTAQEQGVDQAAELWLQNPMIAISSKDARSADLVARMVRENRNIFRLQNWPEWRMTPTAFERLGELRMPVLFVLGDQDTPVVQRVSNETAARIAGAETIRITGADHLPQLTHPDAFMQRVLSFLRR